MYSTSAKSRVIRCDPRDPTWSYASSSVSSARLSRSPCIRTRTSSGTWTTSAPKRRSSIGPLLPGEPEGHGLARLVSRHVHRIDHVLDQEQAPATWLLVAGQLALDVRQLRIAR